jgi:hypothetical protein
MQQQHQPILRPYVRYQETSVHRRLSAFSLWYSIAASHKVEYIIINNLRSETNMQGINQKISLEIVIHALLYQGIASK